MSTGLTLPTPLAANFISLTASHVIPVKLAIGISTLVQVPVVKVIVVKASPAPVPALIGLTCIVVALGSAGVHKSK